MGKIVKFCNSCEEGFAEKFSFCPNCAGELTAFEMKPVEEPSPAVEEPAAEKKIEEQVSNEVVEKAPVSFVSEPEFTKDVNAEETPNVIEEDEAVFEPINFSEESTNGFNSSVDLDSDDILELNVEKPAKEEEVVFASDEENEEEVFVSEDVPETVEVRGDSYERGFIPQEIDKSYEPTYNIKNDDDGGYHVTVVSEKGGNTRNGLLLAASILIIFGFIGLMVYSLFANLADVGSLTEDERLLALLNESPMQSEEPEEKKDKDKGGGGGGGGTENPKPATRGELPTQVKFIPPPPMAVKSLDDPSLVVRNATQGNIKRNRTGDVGIPDGTLSDQMSGGPGSGGGFGTGKGQGFGSGFGTGEGSGTGSGSGAGRGNGTGDGTGDGDGSGRATKPPPPPPPTGPTTAIQILSKPKPGYTDAARQNNVTGVVRVRVTFMANGSIGGVSVVSGLPHGLTEKAIAAARQIRFKPPLKNGQPYSVTKVVVFNFNIY